MTVPRVDTFEHDIADEIKRKEAGFTDIASAGGDVKNTPEAKHSMTPLVLLGMLFVVLIIAAIGSLVYYYRQTPNVMPVENTQTTTPGVSSRSTETLKKISQTLYDTVGASLGNITSSSYGYTIAISNFSPVYSYMLKNEQSFAYDLALAVNTMDIASTTPLFSFSDTTISNQNMRIGEAGSSTVVYAFVHSDTLLISSSTEGILAMRGILSQ